MSKPITIPIRVWKYQRSARKNMSQFQLDCFDYDTHILNTDIDGITNFSLWQKQQKGDWNQWHKDMERSLQVKPPIYKTGNLPKPSLLTRIKRIRRKKI